MLALRNRMSRFLTDSRSQCDPVCDTLSSFYREEFIKCQRCLEQQRECYSERAILEAERGARPGDGAARSTVRQRRCRQGGRSSAPTVRRRDPLVRLVRPQPNSLTALSDLRADVTAVVRAALAAAEAGGLVRRALITSDIEGALQSADAVDVVAVGKAAGPMLLAAVSELAQMPLRHVVGVSPQPPQALPSGARWHTTAHPVPTIAA